MDFHKATAFLNKQSPWTVNRDPKTGAAYYYNTKTGLSSWTAPPELSKAAGGGSTPAAKKPKADPSPWVENVDPNTGAPYFYNTVTGISTWIKAETLLIPAVVKKYHDEHDGGVDKIRATFAKFDTNGDGHLSEPEINEMMGALGFTVNAEYIASVLYKYGTDSADGRVVHIARFPELWALVGPPGEQPSQEAAAVIKREGGTPGESSAASPAKEAAKEAAAATEKEKARSTGVGKVREVFGQFDANGDGILNKAEINEMMGALGFTVNAEYIASVLYKYGTDSPKGRAVPISRFPELWALVATPAEQFDAEAVAAIVRGSATAEPEPAAELALEPVVDIAVEAGAGEEAAPLLPDTVAATPPSPSAGAPAVPTAGAPAVPAVPSAGPLAVPAVPEQTVPAMPKSALPAVPKSAVPAVPDSAAPPPPVPTRVAPMGGDRPGTPKQKQCEVAWQDGSLGLIINETCLVLSVTKGGPADKAGIAASARITSVDGNPVGSKQALLQLVAFAKEQMASGKRMTVVFEVLPKAPALPSEATPALPKRDDPLSPSAVSRGLLQMTADDVVCCGFMSKKGQKRHNWSKRYFELLDCGYLMYYGDDTKKFLKGSVHTNEAISIRLSQNPKKKEGEIEIVLPDRIWRLRPVEESLGTDDWLHVLNGDRMKSVRDLLVKPSLAKTQSIGPTASRHAISLGDLNAE